MSMSQTLSRGLTALEMIAQAVTPPSIETVADDLGVHRSIAYRIVRTLEHHGLIERASDGACLPAAGLAVLARSVAGELHAASIEELTALANTVGLTAFLVVRNRNEAVTVESVEPVGPLVNVSYKPGVRHPVDRGGPGIAILAADPPNVDERPEVTAARTRGWAESTGEVIPGMASVAAPLVGEAAAISVVHLAADGRDHSELAIHVIHAATRIERRLAAWRDQRAHAVET